MKKRYYFCFLIILGISLQAQSQSGTSATAAATIVRPLVITKTADLNFETVAVIVAGEVELKQGRLSSKRPTINLPVPKGTFTAASFFIEGTASYAINFSVPSSPLEITNGKDTYTVTSFKSDPLINPGSNLFGGVFVSVTPLNVIVNYN